MQHQHHYRDLCAKTNGPRWRTAFDALIGAPLRLHRYRYLHSEVVEDALRAFDCSPCRERKE